MKQLYLFFIAAMTYSLSFSQTVTLSHSNNPATVDDGGVSCWNAGSGEYRDNSFFRAYVLSDFIDASSGLEVSAVEFGQGSASEGKAMEVRIYTVTTDNLAMASFTLVTSASFTASSANDLSVVTVPITASIAAGSTIAVEIFAPDHVSHTFFPGINSSGETDDSYIQSAACGITNPSTATSIGFPDNQYVLNVVGETLGMQENTLANITVLPNPVKDVLKINTPNPSDIKSIEIMNLTGQVVFKSNALTEINVGHLNSGVYMLKIKSDKGSVTKKIIKS